MSGVKTPPTQGHLAGKLKGVTGWRGSVGVKIFIFQRTSGDLSHMFNKLQSFPASLGMLECYCLAVHDAASPFRREYWGHYHFVAIWGTVQRKVCVLWGISGVTRLSLICLWYHILILKKQLVSTEQMTFSKSIMTSIIITNYAGMWFSQHGGGTNSGLISLVVKDQDALCRWQE